MVFIYRRDRIISKGDYWLRHVCLYFCLSIRPSAWNMAFTGRIFIKVDI